MNIPMVTIIRDRVVCHVEGMFGLVGMVRSGDRSACTAPTDYLIQVQQRKNERCMANLLFMAFYGWPSS